MTLWDPPAGFDEPLAALSACHRRIEKQLATLTRLQKHLPRHGVDADARNAIDSILRYFTDAAPNHHDDEEIDMFPRILRAAQSTAERAHAFELISHLLVEHRQMADLWSRLRTALESLLAGDATDIERSLCKDFVQQYSRHIEREEGQLVPMAHKLLGADDWAQIGTAMAARRGLPPPDFAL